MSALSFEKLDGALVFLSRRARRERAEVPPFAGPWIAFARTQTVFAGL